MPYRVVRTSLRLWRRHQIPAPEGRSSMTHIRGQVVSPILSFSKSAHRPLLVIFLVGILDLLTEFVDIAIDRDLCWVAVDDSDNLSRGRRGQKNSRRIATDVLPGALNALAAFGECMSALNKLVARIHEIWSPNSLAFRYATTMAISSAANSRSLSSPYAP